MVGERWRDGQMVRYDGRASEASEEEEMREKVRWKQSRNGGERK